MTQDNNCAHTHSKNHLCSIRDRAQQQLAGYSPRADSWACRVGHTWFDHSQMNGLSILQVGRSSTEKACQQKVPVLMKIICRLSMHAQNAMSHINTNLDFKNTVATAWSCSIRSSDFHTFTLPIIKKKNPEKSNQCVYKIHVHLPLVSDLMWGALHIHLVRRGPEQSHARQVRRDLEQYHQEPWYHPWQVKRRLEQFQVTWSLPEERK